MADILEKGQQIWIELPKIGIGLGWGLEGIRYCLEFDASAFMLDDNKKLPANDFFVFYNNDKSPDGAVRSALYSGVELIEGMSFEEALIIDLTMIDSRIQEIVITISSYRNAQIKQNPGQAIDLFICIYDILTKRELIKSQLEINSSIEQVIEMGRLVKYRDEWKFETMGISYECGLEYLVNKYIYSAI